MKPKLTVKRIKMLVMMGRISQTREELEKRLNNGTNQKELKKALDDVFAIPQQEYENLLFNQLKFKLDEFKKLTGKGIDAEGLDEADRIVENVLMSLFNLNSDAEKN